MKMKLLLPIIFVVAVMGAVYMIADSEDSDAAVVDPSTGTQVGDLYYTFSGTDATVVGITSSLSSATSITIPDTVTSGGTTYNVTAIGDYVFSDLSSLQTITLPSGLTSIGIHAFSGCTNLALTSLPSGLTSIGQSAFSGCTNLALTSLPSGVTGITDFAFQNCTNLALTSLPSGLTSIGNQAFQNCTNLALTSLPSGLTDIIASAFSGCTNLALTSLPSGLTSIGFSVFYKCTNLALTSLPSGLTSIGNQAFQNCTNLALTSLPDGVTSIGASAFSGCTNLKYLVITSSPTIGTNAFRSTFITEVLNLGSTEISAGSYGLPNDCVVRSNIEDVSMIQQVEYEEHTTEVVDKEGSEYTLMNLLPVLVVIGLVMAALFALIRVRAQD